VVHADQLTMTQFALPAGAFSYGDRSTSSRPNQPKLVFDAHNATWTILDRLVKTSPAYVRPLLALERARLKRYEGRLVQKFDYTLAVTDIDRLALLEAAGRQAPASAFDGRLRVIPIAIDTTQDPLVPRKLGGCQILAIGSLHYPPNAGGIRWFMQDVFPLVQQAMPGARLTVIGKNPPADFLRMAESSQGAIEVTGYVADLAPYLRETTLMVVPVLAGGGMRVRILEAFARGLPVVTTTIGLEGIDAQAGRDVLVADTPETFAAGVTQVLEDTHLQQQLVTNGRALVENRYDWQAVLKQLDEVYQL
jgi:glycosyltransferase involved in cell wall biosynthesis